MTYILEVVEEEECRFYPTLYRILTYFKENISEVCNVQHEFVTDFVPAKLTQI
jgi:hypothetical protein